MSNKFSGLVNERGNLHNDAKAYIDERFVKEVKAIYKYAETESHTKVIEAILKSIIADLSYDRSQEIKND